MAAPPELDDLDLDLGWMERELIGVREPVRLILHDPEPGSRAGERLNEAAIAIAGASHGAVVVQQEPPGGYPDLVARPGMSLACGDRANIHYHAIPAGPEAAPFREAILGLTRGVGVSREAARGLEPLEAPARLVVFMAAACTHCPLAVRSAIQLALADPRVDTSIVDAQFFTALASRHKVRSVPMTLIDGELSLTGVVPMAALAAHLVARGSPAHAAHTLRSHVEAGRFGAAVAMFEGPEGARSFVDLWRGSTMSLRLGLRLAADEALAADPAAFDAVIGELIGLIEAPDAALRGDTADLLGSIGDPVVIPAISGLLDDPNPDVAEIAQEIIELLRVG